MTLFDVLPHDLIRPVVEFGVLINPFIALSLLSVILLLLYHQPPRPAFAWGFLIFVVLAGGVICTGYPRFLELAPPVGIAMMVTSFGCLVEAFVRRLRFHWITGLCALTITGGFFLFLACACILPAM
jgi:hypothetical protein